MATIDEKDVLRFERELAVLEQSKRANDELFALYKVLGGVSPKFEAERLELDKKIKNIRDALKALRQAFELQQAKKGMES